MTNQRIKVGILWNNLQFISLQPNERMKKPENVTAIIVKCLSLSHFKLIFYYIFITQSLLLLLSISQLKVTSIALYCMCLILERYYTIFSLFSISHFPLPFLLFFFIVSSYTAAAAAISHNLPFWLLRLNSFAQQLYSTFHIKHKIVTLLLKFLKK